MSSNFGRAPKVPSLFGWEELSPLRVLVSDICQLSKDCRLWVGNPPDSVLLLELRYRPWWASSVSPSPGSVCEVQTFRFALYLCLSELCGIPHLLLVKPSSLDQVLPMLPWTATFHSVLHWFQGHQLERCFLCSWVCPSRCPLHVYRILLASPPRPFPTSFSLLLTHPFFPSSSFTIWTFVFTMTPFPISIAFFYYGKLQPEVLHYISLTVSDSWW